MKLLFSTLQTNRKFLLFIFVALWFIYHQNWFATVALNLGKLDLAQVIVAETNQADRSAQEWLEKSLAHSKGIDSIQVNALIGLGTLALERHDTKESQSLLESNSAVVKNSIGSLLLGHAYVANGEEDQAISIWRSAGVSNKYLIYYGLITKDPKWYRLATIIDPSSHGFFLLATASQGLNEWDNAIASYEKALALNSNWTYNGQKFLAAYYLGLALDSQGGDRRMEAKSAYIQALSISETYGVYPNTHGTIYQRLANLAKARGNSPEEIDWLISLANLNPNALHYIRLGQALFAQAGLKAADPSFKQALNAPNANPDIVRQIGQFLIAHGELDGARQYCDHLVPPQLRDSWQIVACQAEILLAEGDVLNSYRVLERGLSKNLSSDYTSQLLTNVCQQLSDMPPALCKNMDEK